MTKPLNGGDPQKLCMLVHLCPLTSDLVHGEVADITAVTAVTADGTVAIGEDIADLKAGMRRLSREYSVW